MRAIRFLCLSCLSAAACYSFPISGSNVLVQLGPAATGPTNDALSLQLPQAPTNGDLLVAVLTSDPPVMFSPADATSWTSAGYLGGTVVQTQIFWSLLPGAQEQQVFVPAGSLTGRVAGAISEWRMGEADTHTPTTIAMGTTASVIDVAYEANAPGELAISVYQQGLAGEQFTRRSGWKSWFSGTFNNATTAVDYHTDVPMGAGTETVDSSAPAYYSGYAVTFRPAPTD